MKKVSKLIASVLLGVSVVAFSPVVEVHAEWRNNNIGWWWHEGTFYGDYVTNAWRLINYKWYYFGADGYMLHDTIAPDGYRVGSDGSWITNNPIKATGNSASVDLANSNAPGVILDNNSLNLKVGEIGNVKLVKINTNYTGNSLPPTVIWSSSNPNVAKVEWGKITAVSEGKATITCKTTDENIPWATCLVTVSPSINNKNNSVPAVILNKPSMTLNVGEIKALPVPTVINNPADTSVNHLVWSSNNNSVASVQAGKVTAVGVGTATITCATQDGNEKPDTCVVTVK